MGRLADEITLKLPQLSSGSRLYAIACDMARQHLPATAREAFARAVRGDAGLLAALVGDDVISQRADIYLQGVRRDIANGPVTEKDGSRGHTNDAHHGDVALAPSASLPKTGHMKNDAQNVVAQLRQPLGGESGQEIVDIHQYYAAPPPSESELHGEGHLEDDAQDGHAWSMQPVEGGDGQRANEAQTPPAAPPSPVVSSRGQECSELQAERASAADAIRPTIPMPRRSPAAMAAVQGIMSKSIVFRLHDSRDIMDVQFHELAKIRDNGRRKARVFTREALVADYLIKNCTYANPDPFEKVGTYFPVKTLELAVAEASRKEPANA